MEKAAAAAASKLDYQTIAPGKVSSLRKFQGLETVNN